MNIAIKGAVPGVKDMIAFLSANGAYHVACVLENNGAKIGQEIAGVPVLSTLRVRKAYQEGIVDAVVLPGSLKRKTLASMERELCEMGVASKDIFVVHPACVHRGGTVVPYATWETQSLDYIEFHVSHVCNLNCKGCCHFSSLTKRKFPNFDEWNEGFMRLQEFIPYIREIHLLGGEPLINPELSRYALRTRELYPDAKIEIISNAILADKLAEETVKDLQCANIKISITAYPGVLDRIGRGIDFLHVRGLLGNIHMATEFTKMLSRVKRPFPYRTTESVCHCPNLDGTKLYPCPLIAYLSDFNAQFQIDFPTEGGCVDLKETDMTPARLKEELYRPFPLCEYCRSYFTEGNRASNDVSLAWANYHGDLPKVSDWLLERDL